MKKLLSTAAVAAIAAVTSSAVHAATADGTMDVSATVSRTCTVTADALAFNTVSTSAATTTQSAVSISCTAGSSSDIPTMTFSGGSNLNVTSGLRQMVGGDSTTALVPYTLSAAGGINLTPTATVSAATSDGGSSYSATVNGSIDANANYQIGNYSDTVTVTVTYAQ